MRPLKPSLLRPLLLLKIRRKLLVIMLPARRYGEHHRPKPPPELIRIREHLSEHARHHGRIVPVDTAPEGGQDEVGAIAEGEGGEGAVYSIGEGGEEGTAFHFEFLVEVLGYA